MISATASFRRRPAVICDLLANARASQQHLDGEGHDGAERADDRQPKTKGPKRIKVVASSLSCANEHRENRAAGRRTPYGAENGSDIERDRLRTSLRKSPIRFDVARRLCDSMARLR